MKILLAEDDKMIAKGLLYAFKQHNYQLIHTESIKETEEALKKAVPDIAVIDITLPDGNGFDLYEDLIKKLDIPALFLTARDDEEGIVKGLEIGAEDYITKPFFTKELIVRINKIILRKKKNPVVHIHDIKFDLDKMEVYKNDSKVNLTSLELKIFHLLITNINKTVSRNDIIEKIWIWTGNDINDNSVTVYLKRIRNKLDTDIIKTVKGIGYRIDADS